MKIKKLIKLYHKVNKYVDKIDKFNKNNGNNSYCNTSDDILSTFALHIFETKHYKKL